MINNVLIILIALFSYMIGFIWCWICELVEEIDERREERERATFEG